jgi:hypothetical protein
MGNGNSNSSERIKQEEFEKSEVGQYELMLYHFKDSKIIKYDERLKKWISCISFRHHEHVFGYYDTPEEAINKALDKLEEVYGENKSELYKNWLPYINLRKNKNFVDN